MAFSVELAVKTVHYTGPIITFLYYLLSSLWAVIHLETSVTVARRQIRYFVLGSTAFVIGTFVAQSLIIIVQLLREADTSFATKHSNVYSLSGVVLWTVFLATFVNSDQHPRYPYTFSWVLTLAADVSASALTAVETGPSSLADWSLLGLQTVRDVVIVALVILCYISNQRESRKDEDTEPLLGSERGVGATPNDEEEEDEMDDYNKEREERKAKLKARLKEEGNWFTYLRAYTVFLPHIWPSSRKVLQLNMIGVGLCVLASRALIILTPRQLGIIINSLSSGSLYDSFMAIGLYAIYGWLGGYAGIEGLRQFLWIPVESNAEQRLETASFDHVMELSCDFHDGKRSGEIIAAMDQGGSLTQLLEIALYQVGPMLLDVVLAWFYFYFLLDEYLVLIGMTVSVAYAWVTIHMDERRRRTRRLNNNDFRVKNQSKFDIITGWRTVMCFNRKSYAQDRFASTVDRYQYTSRKRIRMLYETMGIQALVLGIGGFCAYFFAAYQVHTKGVDVGTFVTLMTYWGSFTGRLPTIIYYNQHLQRLLIDAEELLTLFQRKASVKDGPNELCIHGGHVEFEKVGFSYDGNKEIIRDLDFHAGSGKTIALVGETGAGKSTVLKLLFRFYDVTAGSICIDGQDIRNVTLSSLREHIGVVPQDPVLFNDTIKANIRFARLSATDDDIVEACKAAAIHEKILTFTKGYATQVGERGIKLSGGELQRVAIARAILKKPQIVLLDEATSAVDSETEERIQEGLQQLCKGRTTFVVAHRLSTIKDADRILVVRDGAILEQGTSAELLKSKGKYYSLWTKQMGLVGTLDKNENSESSAATLSSGKPGSPKAATSEETSPTETLQSLGSLDGEASRDDTKAGTKKDSPATPRPAAETESGDADNKSKTSTDRRQSRQRSPFRPDAPEFIPRYQSGHATPLNGVNYSQGFNTPSTEGGQKVHGGDDPSNENGRPAVGDSSATSIGASRVGGSVASKSGISSRRLSQIKSEPNGGLSSLPQSQADGASAFDAAPVLRPTTGIKGFLSKRRLSSPSGPNNSTEERLLVAQAHKDRRRRGRNGSAAEGSAGSTGQGSALDGDDLAVGADDAAVPDVPNSTPTGAGTPTDARTRPSSSA